MIKPHEARKRLRTLQKRADYLNKRITRSPIDLSFDEEERQALLWAISELEPRFRKAESHVTDIEL